MISRVFDAPRDFLWQCFTDPERMKQWWGPKGFTVIASKMDLRVGGTYHYGMKAPDGSPMWGLFSLSRDRAAGAAGLRQFVLGREAGGVTRHPAGADLAAANAFDLHLRGRARRQDQIHRALAGHSTPRRKSRPTFDSDQSRVSMTNGWTGTMDQLEAYLAKAQ